MTPSPTIITGRVVEPRSIALVGARPRERSLGRKVLANLRSGGFAGPIFLVNPKHPEIDGIASVPSLSALPSPPELVVNTAPAPEVPAIVECAVEIGNAAAVIITAGLGRGPGSLADQCRSTAYRHGLRIVGPNGTGVRPLMSVSMRAFQRGPRRLATWR